MSCLTLRVLLCRSSPRKGSDAHSTGHTLIRSAFRQRYDTSTPKVHRLLHCLDICLNMSLDDTGQWGIRINDQWRVCFVWNDGRAERVEICDYR